MFMLSLIIKYLVKYMSNISSEITMVLCLKCDYLQASGIEIIYNNIIS